jgi:hypothetical protein
MGVRIDGKRFVIAFFDTRAAGVVVARSLAEPPPGDDGHPVGVLVHDDAGGPDVMAFGDDGADDPRGIARLLGVIGSALVGGVMPARPHFFDDASELTTDDIARIGAEIEAGHAAVAVLEERRVAERLVVRLAELGGRTEVHRLTERGLRQAATMPPLAS